MVMLYSDVSCHEIFDIKSSDEVKNEHAFVFNALVKVLTFVLPTSRDQRIPFHANQFQTGSKLLLRHALSTHTIHLPVSSVFRSRLLKTFWFTDSALLVFLTQACRCERLIKHAKRHLQCVPSGHELLINNNQETRLLRLFVLLMWEAHLHPKASVKLSVDNWMITQAASVGVYVCLIIPTSTSAVHRLCNVRVLEKMSGLVWQTKRLSSGYLTGVMCR